MRLFEAILDANNRAVAGDEKAGLHPSEYADSLPVVALTCIDPRLNPLIPEVLGIPEDQFIWLRNAGNIITGPLSSTMRSLALACAVKGGREIIILGHTDCLVRKTTVLELTGRFKAFGIERDRLPENLNDYFGLFASERQNVLHGVEHVRASPLIGANIPVHGLLVDIQTGRLEWLVNGYHAIGAVVSPPASPSSSPIMAAMEELGAHVPPLTAVEWKTPPAIPPEVSGPLNEWLPKSRLVEPDEHEPPPLAPKQSAKPIPIPPPIRPGGFSGRNPKGRR